MFDKELFQSHLERAHGASSDYDAFGARWNAFNVYYESLFQPRRQRELDLILLAAEALTGADYAVFLTPATTKQLFGIRPIFHERDWQRRGIRNTQEHRNLKVALEEISLGRMPTKADVVLLLTLLYVVRCNMFHGFKTPSSKRDIEVLSAANAVFAPFIETLAHRIL
jgi:hypothetical protein